MVVMPDTSILIDIRDHLAKLDEATGLIVHPNWSRRETPLEALQDLVQLWWWRDLRFAVSPAHLADGPLNADRKRAREAAVRELDRDFYERGGLETIVEDGWSVEDAPCAIHSIPPVASRSESPAAAEWKWPRDEPDRRLAEAAYDAGSHVFLTTDKGILRSHSSLFAHGMAVLSPMQLIEALDNSGELDLNRGGDFLITDLSTLSRLYAGFGGE